jgi:hypothetical protein
MDWPPSSTTPLTIRYAIPFRPLHEAEPCQSGFQYEGPLLAVNLGFMLSRPSMIEVDVDPCQLAFQTGPDCLHVSLFLHYG